MASSINGFGTTYYGAGDFHGDGSYITTKWIICAFIPVIPTSSMRVQTVSAGFFSGTQYAVVGEVPLDGLQVIKTWLYTALILALIFGLMDSKLPEAVKAVALIAGVLLPHVLRYFAKKNAIAVAAAPAWQPPAKPNPFAGTPMPAGLVTTCPKCAYTRKADDHAPAWQCPSCQVAYNKVTPQALAAQAEARARRN